MSPFPSRQNLILLAEDEPINVLLIRRALNQVGQNTQLEAVSDGEQAVRYLQGEGLYGDRDRFPLPDLVITNIKMPRMNGLELLSWIKQHPQFFPLPVVILSSSDDPDEMDQAAQLGANSCLVKPSSPMELVETMRSIIALLSIEPSFLDNF